MLLTLLYLLISIQKSRNVLLKPVTSKYLIENTINNILANETNILLVNSNLRLSVPTMHFDSSLRNVYELTQFKDLHIVLNCTETKNITKLLNQFVEHVGLLEKAYTMILVKEKPDKSTVEFLIQNEIHQVVFINLNDVKFSGWPKSPRRFKACYTDVIPYTTLDNNKQGLFFCLLCISI